LLGDYSFLYFLRQERDVVMYIAPILFVAGQEFLKKGRAIAPPKNRLHGALFI